MLESEIRAKLKIQFLLGRDANEILKSKEKLKKGAYTHESISNKKVIQEIANSQLLSLYVDSQYP
jgi:hypothetical protein